MHASFTFALSVQQNLKSSKLVETLINLLRPTMLTYAGVAVNAELLITNGKIKLSRKILQPFCFSFRNVYQLTSNVHVKYFHKPMIFEKKELAAIMPRQL